MKANDLFGTLQDAITIEWRKHLQANNHDVHVILDEFYKNMPELVDALIEAWQAEHGVVKDYDNLLKDLDINDMSALDYIELLKDMTKRGREEVLKGETELESLCDDILAQIDSTMYKLKELTDEGKLYDYKESHKMKSLSDFIKENLDK